MITERPTRGDKNASVAFPDALGHKKGRRSPSFFVFKTAQGVTELAHRPSECAEDLSVDEPALALDPDVKTAESVTNAPSHKPNFSPLR